MPALSSQPQQPDSPNAHPSWKSKLAKQGRSLMAAFAIGMTEVPKEDNTSLETALLSMGDLKGVMVIFKNGAKAMAEELLKDGTDAKMSEVEEIVHTAPVQKAA
jgi:hypothetical protein